MRALLAALGLLAVAAAPAQPARPGVGQGAQDGFVARLTAPVRAALAAGRAPALVPPVPLTVTWRPVRLGAIELGAALVAVRAADLDGDGAGELYAVTAREVIALGLAGGKLKELGRVPFEGQLAVLAPREPVGTAVVDAGALVAAASPWARELRVTWDGTTLAARAADPPFLVCPGERLALVPGRNHFGDLAAPVLGVRCRADLVAADGRPLVIRAVLTGTVLTVTGEVCAPASGSRARACEPAFTHAYKDYGAVFEIADVDRDGTPEVLVTGAGPPGEPDAVKVMSVGGDDKKGRFRKQFTGGVAGLAVLDADADGAPEVLALVRLVGATRVDVWRLD